jgi:DNA (cytosine-5)-methyltransferase 1
MSRSGQSGKSTARPLEVVSLFSGAMGLDIGLEQTGQFETVAAIESHPAFCQTIRKNRDAGRTKRKDLRVYEGDIRGLDPCEIMRDLNLRPGELDLLIGGPPCQSFSTSGRRGTVQDPRGTLLWEFLRFVAAFRPKFFLMENVRGLLSAAVHHRPIAERPENGGPPLSREEQPGSVVRLFAEDLRSIAGTPYRLDVFEVNAVNYGAPQLRERALFIGNRFGRAVDFPAPTHGFSEGLKPYATLGDAIKRISDDNSVIMDFSPRKKRYLSMVPPGGNWRSLPVKLQKESMGRAWIAKGGRSGWWRRLSYDLPSPTILTLPNHASTALCHPDEARALTLRECALVQEFPNEWQFCGTTQEQYAQVGNAVPVRLGVVAGECLACELRAARVAATAVVDEQYAPRIIYLRSHVRTRQWFKRGRVFVWSDVIEDNEEARYGPPTTEVKVRPLGKSKVARNRTSGVRPISDAAGVADLPPT